MPSSKFVQVPPPLLTDIEAVLAEIRAALDDAGTPVSPDDLSFETPDGKKLDGMGAFELAQNAGVFVGVIVATKLTEEFVDAVLLPRLRTKFSDMQDALEAFVERLRSDRP